MSNVWLFDNLVVWRIGGFVVWWFMVPWFGNFVVWWFWLFGCVFVALWFGGLVVLWFGGWWFCGFLVLSLLVY